MKGEKGQPTSSKGVPCTLIRHTDLCSPRVSRSQSFRHWWERERERMRMKVRVKRVEGEGEGGVVREKRVRMKRVKGEW